MRLFIAFECGEAVVRELISVQEALRRRWPQIKYTQAAQLHITVKFLGESREDQLPEIIRHLEQTAAMHPPFQLSLTGLGCFPPDRPPRIIWAAAHDPHNTLAACAKELDARCSELGFVPEEREFKPHITLARVKDAGQAKGLPAALAKVPLAPIACPAAHLVLMQSTLTPEGPIYEVLKEAPFRG